MIDIINIGVNYIIEMVAAWQYFRSFTVRNVQNRQSVCLW